MRLSIQWFFILLSLFCLSYGLEALADQNQIAASEDVIQQGAMQTGVATNSLQVGDRRLEIVMPPEYGLFQPAIGKSY
ncbi:MAG: hypothetical protein ACOH5I_08790 [Oligoflexus sp.]